MLKNISKSSIFKQFAGFSLGPIIGMLISMLTVPIITRLVLPEEFGKASLFTLVQTVLNIIILFGIDQSYVRFYNQKDTDTKKLMFNSLVLPSIFCFFFVIFVVLLRSKISYFMFNQYERLIMFSFIIYLPSLLLNRFALLSIRMNLQGKVYSFLTVLQQILNFIILVLFLYFVERSFRSIIFATIISCVLTTIVAIFFARNTFKYEGFLFEWTLFKQLVLYGAPLLPATILSWVLNSADKFTIRSMSTFQELGLYASAFKIVALLTIMQTLFTTAWTPIAFKWYENDVPRNKFEQVSTLLLCIMTTLFALIVILRDVIFLFLGPEYRGTSGIFVFLLFVPVMYTVSETTCLGIAFSKKTMFNLYISIVVAIINITGNYFLVPSYGAIGAAVSTCFSYIVFFWARTLFSRKLWFKFNLQKFTISIFLLILFGLNILLFENKAVELTIFTVLVFYNIILLKKTFFFDSSKKMI